MTENSSEFRVIGKSAWHTRFADKSSSFIIDFSEKLFQLREVQANVFICD